MCINISICAYTSLQATRELVTLLMDCAKKATEERAHSVPAQTWQGEPSPARESRAGRAIGSRWATCRTSACCRTPKDTPCSAPPAHRATQSRTFPSAQSVPVQMWGGASPVPMPMRHRGAQSRCRCARACAVEYEYQCSSAYSRSSSDHSAKGNASDSCACVGVCVWVGARMRACVRVRACVGVGVCI